MRKHIMFDCYGANQHQLDEVKHINDCLNRMVYSLKLTPVCPPVLVPYYYGKVKEDLGISAFILLEGGHITIHTFPIRECYFVDVYSEEDFNEKDALKFLQKELPYDESISFHHVVDRVEKRFDIEPYDAACDFGPHLMCEIKSTFVPTMENFFDFLEHIVDEIHMDPITRPFVIKSTAKKPKYLSAIIIIAQSHIALHYCYKTGAIFADIFSCAPFDYSNSEKIYQSLGTVVSSVLEPRGTKHIYKVKSTASKDDLKASMRWQRAIKK